MNIKLVRKISNREVIHYAAGETLITSFHRNVYVKTATKEFKIKLPWVIPDFLGGIRLIRRALRLDKCNVVPLDSDCNNLVVIRQHSVYHYSNKTKKLTKTLSLKNCRNVIHQSICVLDESTIIFGEYGANKNRSAVPVYKSSDGGLTWKNIFTFKPGSIKHVHGCYWDPYEEKIWTITGDFNGECYMLVADSNFESLECLGDGTQVWRACNVFFKCDKVVWLMDSQLEDCHVVSMDRATRSIEKLQALPGPVWYIKSLSDNYFLAATANEKGPGVKDDCAHFMVSKDGIEWESIKKFRKDKWPKRYFKNGVIGFADGRQSSDYFFIFGEALHELEGKVFECTLEV
jgi:hypothetical protein